jgi:hypothetical protein
MRRTITVLSLFAFAFAALAQSSLVAPNGYGNVEGNSSATSPFTSSSFRLQMVYNASLFAGLGPIRISSISFRIDGASSGDVLYVFSGATVQLSTTPVAPDALSPVFANNVGGNVQTIFNGAISFGGAYQAGASPQPFGQSIPGSSSFIYDPSQGNLLLDIFAGGGMTVFPGALDAQFTAGDSISRVFANSETALSGTVDSLGLVTRFGYTVPEPSTWALAALAAVLAWLVRRKHGSPSDRES